MASNHSMPTHGSAALLAHVGRYVDEVSEREISDYELEDLLEIADQLRLDEEPDTDEGPA